MAKPWKKGHIAILASSKTHVSCTVIHTLGHVFDSIWAPIKLDESALCYLYTCCQIISHTIHVWCIYLHLVDFYGFYVGKYTSPMDATGKLDNSLFSKTQMSHQKKPSYFPLDPG